jgi:hypothetical protein
MLNSRKPYHRQEIQILLVQDQEQNYYQIRKYLLLQIYLVCEQPEKYHHQSEQTSLSTSYCSNCTSTLLNLEQNKYNARQQIYINQADNKICKPI